MCETGVVVVNVRFGRSNLPCVGCSYINDMVGMGSGFGALRGLQTTEPICDVSETYQTYGAYQQDFKNAIT